MNNMDLTPQQRKSLIAVARGEQSADIVLINGNWVSVQSGEIVPSTDIAIKDDFIAYVGDDASHTIGEGTTVIDAVQKCFVPGLLDGHMHVESGMITITEFVRAVAKRGTTGMFIDPHEIANVFGLKGIQQMANEALVQPIHVFVQVPSCVPSAPGLETSGASITPEDVSEAMKWEHIIGLGEVMNYPGVASGDDKMIAEIYNAQVMGGVIGGHYASQDLGKMFHAYVAGGAEDDHEGTRVEDAIARVRQGMKAMLRYGSGWHDVAAQVKAITEMGLDSRHFILCTDDSHADTLVSEGHMDRVVRHAIAQGVEPMTAIQMATINTAEHFGVSKWLGMIAPGRYADILVVESLEDFFPELVIAKGRLIARNGEWIKPLKSYTYPEWIKQSVRVKKVFTAEDFRIRVDSEDDVLNVNVIGVIENQAPTKHLVMQLPVDSGELTANINMDIAKAAVIERHHGSGNMAMGFINGFGLKRNCAIASTVAHDSHNIIVIGTDDTQMAVAVNQLVNMGGGQIVVKDGEVIGAVPLPIAGLMSDQPADVVAKQAQTVLDGFKTCGCMMNNPNMQLSLLALVVIPELRLSDKGLVDVSRFEFISLVEK